ncbi:MAG: hypothetical protein DHS20C05_19320 [Hyphococcus sp.]|nr:MAG: hypothetical protein DHS20C05_19320 [Marinicaulis sp.]
MELEYLLPDQALSDYVRAYYYFATPTDAMQPICAELANIRIVLEGSGELIMPERAPTPITSAFLIGPTSGAYLMHAHAGTRVFGIGIRPRGWAHLFSINAFEAADKILDLTDVARKVAGVELAEVTQADDLATMAKVCDRYFAALLERRTGRINPYPQAIETWLLNDDDLNIDHLMQTMSVSRRQMDRLAKKYFGASPKVLQRKYRALRAADRLREGIVHWRAAAGPSFYDQSHFIKEFKTFVGVTPAQYMDNQAALMRAVQAKRHLNHVDLPLASV